MKTKVRHAFIAFAISGTAGLLRILGIFDMELIEAIEFLGLLALLTAFFIANCRVFGKMIQSATKK